MASSDTAIVAIVFLVLWFTTGFMMLVGGTYYFYINQNKDRETITRINNNVFEIERMMRLMNTNFGALNGTAHHVRDTSTKRES